MYFAFSRGKKSEISGEAVRNIQAMLAETTYMQKNTKSHLWLTTCHLAAARKSQLLLSITWLIQHDRVRNFQLRRAMRIGETGASPDLI